MQLRKINKKRMKKNYRKMEKSKVKIKLNPKNRRIN